MDVLTAILVCSLHPDEALVRSLIEVHTGGNRFFVGDLDALTSVETATDAAAAQANAARVTQSGHRPALGVMAVPPEWATTYDRDPRELWDPCVNVAVGTAKLSDFDYQCRARGNGKERPRRALKSLTSTANRACILRRFAAALRLPQTLVSEVLRHISRSSRRSQDRKQAAPQAGADWGRSSVPAGSARLPLPNF